jgi:ureidoacrylate peracid hydrolase
METRRVTIEAAPQPACIDLSKSAALVIDMQNDFGSTGGMFQRAGIDIAAIRAAIAPTSRAIGALRACGVPVVYLKMGFRPDLSDLGPPEHERDRRAEARGR